MGCQLPYAEAIGDKRVIQGHTRVTLSLITGFHLLSEYFIRSHINSDNYLRRESNRGLRELLPDVLPLDTAALFSIATRIKMDL